MTCPSCGAALAEDQRYCLNCGQRRGEPRVDFRRHLDSQATVTKDPPPPPPPEKPQRDYAPLAAAGGIAVLGVMLLIGVLIGRGTGGGEESAATPQVITVGAAESSAADGNEEAQSDNGAGKTGRKDPGGKSKKQKNVVAGGSADTGNAPVASDDQLQALQEKTGEEYAEESAKLPDEIATPGKPPPTDGKAPGGGSGGVTLE